MAQTNKTFTSTTLPASDLNTYLMKQSNIQVDSGTTPSSPQEGMTIIDTTNNQRLIWSGTAWIPMEGYGAWKTFASVAAGISSGGSTVTMRYQQRGKTCDFVVNMNFGGAATVGGPTNLSLPFTASSAMPYCPCSAFYYDSNLGVYFPGVAYIGASNTAVYCFIAGGGNITATTPMTWASGDQIAVSGTYEIA